MEIQEYQAKAKDIKISADFFNFSPKDSAKHDYRKNDRIPVKD